MTRANTNTRTIRYRWAPTGTTVYEQDLPTELTDAEARIYIAGQLSSYVRDVELTDDPANMPSRETRARSYMVRDTIDVGSYCRVAATTYTTAGTIVAGTMVRVCRYHLAHPSTQRGVEVDVMVIPGPYTLRPDTVRNRAAQAYPATISAGLLESGLLDSTEAGS